MQNTTLRRLRWATPVVAGAAVAAAAILPGVAAGSDHPALPSRGASQLLADELMLKTPSLSGTIVETARLGLPDLPSTGRGSASLSWENLVTGSHTARLWLDGPDRQRVALVGDLAESDVVHDGSDVWIYSSSANHVTHIAVPANLEKQAESSVRSSTPLSPPQAAAEAIAAITPTTKVSVDATARVAGRAAYQIVLSPKDPHALITSVTIALDSETKVPLRVRVYGQDRTTPALETAFTDVTFARPPASVFRFIPPTGAEVPQATLADVLEGHVLPSVSSGRVSIRKPDAGTGDVGTRVVGGKAIGGKAIGTAPGFATKTIGSGWTEVVVTDGSALTDLALGSSGQLAGVLLNSATKVPQGRLITTALLSVLLTDDGRLYAGAVDGATLQKVAATGIPESAR